ncbi:hypothetical protein LSH36_380g02079 [Paralvinella palmiformis]|uniref:Peptidoglycan recognition protein family domain-containing protein n=1 Tax=Paralvinella palmiformis TaxID=53620 RepID=A0AAD9MZA8_9ANNE|nr:hypothetical protein LSH36_380g02079 [Paralvinella palmiformis]
MDEEISNTNYSRISCLLMQEGTRRAQEVVLMNLPERKSLAQVLCEKKNQLHDLMSKQRIITRSQYDVLYPFTGDMSTIDISLWLVLARNITMKSSRKGIIWNRSPEKHETLWAHDLIRLREIRNFLFHVSAPELVGEKFNEIRTELVHVLRRLGTSDAAIEDHMRRDLDPQQTKICVLQIREQYMEEQNVLLLQAAQHKRHTRIITVVLSLLAVIVLIGVSLPLGWYFSQQPPCTKYVRRITSNAGVFYFMPRKGWKAAPMKNSETNQNLTKPVKIAAIFHTGILTDRCDITTDCCNQVKYIQKSQMSGGIFDDISYNYLIGNDGVVYEGRGSQYMSAACLHRNSEIVSIAIMGHYACQKPGSEAMVALYVFLDYITNMTPETQIKEPILVQNYHLYGQCQININKKVRFPDSPGAGVMQELQFWTKHWV